MTVTTNLIGHVETPELGDHPYAVDQDGRPFVPTGSSGVVLGLRLGDSVFGFDADHAAPGVTLTHPDQAARHALTAFACLGNRAVVRSGPAAGASGRVLGKRGEAGRVIAIFPQDVLARLAPDDAIAISGVGQGATTPTPETTLINTDPGLLPALPVAIGSRVGVSLRGVVPSHLIGNGIGRPAQMWDLDVQLRPDTAEHWRLADLRLGDLLGIQDLDVRHNVGYREGWFTVGTMVHGWSPLPGHGPGLMPMLCGPASAFEVEVDRHGHVGVTGAALGLTDV